MTVPIIEGPAERKGRGAFYTPGPITRFMARWAVRSADERVLEPSCGDGAFIGSLVERYGELGRTDLATALTGIELAPEEARRAALLAPSATILAGSFFSIEPSATGPVNAVVGNPPYIRYHGWTGAARDESLRRAASLGVELTGLASSWASFVVWATAFLSGPSGRLALVVPAELLSTEYAAPVRRFLAGRFSSIVVVAFDSLAFADAQVDAVLLLASNDDERGMRVVRLPDASALATVDIAPSPALPPPAGTAPGDGRWIRSIDGPAAGLYDELLGAGGVVRLGDVASVDIGFVSGANDYFLLDDAAVRRHRLPPDVLRPAVGRPRELAGIETTATEQRRLFLPSEDPADHDRATRAYLRRGVELGIPLRYKPRMRRTWFRVPLPKVTADLFLPYMSHHGPRLVTNPAGALSSNLLHGVALTDRSVDARVLATAALSALTLLSAEIEGRAYGGGVLKLETKEAERLAILAPDAAQARTLQRDFDELDALVRANETDQASARVDDVLDLPHGDLVRAADTYRGRRQQRGRSRMGG